MFVIYNLLLNVCKYFPSKLSNFRLNKLKQQTDDILRLVYLCIKRWMLCFNLIDIALHLVSLLMLYVPTIHITLHSVLVSCSICKQFIKSTGMINEMWITLDLQREKRLTLNPFLVGKVYEYRFSAWLLKPVRHGSRDPYWTWLTEIFR